MEFLSNLGIKQKFILCSLLPVLGMGLAMASGGAAVGGLVAAVLVAAGLFLAWDFGSDIENLLAEGKTLINGLANKDYNVSVTRNVGSDIGQLLFSLSNLAKSLQRQQAEVGGGDVAAAQKLAAIDVADTSIMIADNEMNIVYVNDAVKEMLRNREVELKTKLPSFNVASLVGTNVDSFHVNPAHQRNMIKNLSDSYITDLPIGELTFGLIATPIYNDKKVRIGTVVEWSDKTDALAEQAELDVVAGENAAIRNALDVCNTSVMMADADLNINYMNTAVKNMLQEAESQLQTVLPNFRTATLMGTCVDDFHANPAHQRGMLAKLTDTYRTDLPLAGFTFGLTATPMFDEDGARLGTVVEWENKTVALAALEKERKLASSNSRIKQALDVCNTAVMMADADLNIIYMNSAVQDMMSSAETQMQTALPNFRADQLMGTCVDDFHKNPAHQRGMLKNLKEVYNTDLPVAGFTFGLIATPLYGDDGERLGTVVEWDNKTERLAVQEEERRLAAENLRIKQALDVCNTSVMMADEDLNIIYMNDAVTQMMSDAEKQLQTALPNFRSNQLMGTCVDDFHKNPAHQRGMLKDLKTTYSTDLPLAGFTFGLIATPLYDDEGMRLGTVVEWDNKTERLEAQENERRIASDNLRIKQALDVCNTSVMMADPDLNIIYMNEAVTEMMQGAEKQLQTALPSFNAKGLIGTCVDDFHKNPSHQRGMLKDLKTTYQTDLPLAGFTFGLIATPLYDDAGERLGTVVEWDNKTERLAKAEEEAEIAADNLRIRQALDVCDSPVMLGDNDLNIIYMNNAVTKMMRDKERDIQQAVPNFRSDQLMGICVDDFHKNPQYQRSMLRDLRAAHYVDLELGGSTFGLIATPLNDSSGTRLGTVIEWSDKTEALAKEKEARAIADANARIKQALDVVGTSAMLADPEMNIIYMNNSVTQMMREAQSDIRSDLPNFNADTLMGTNVDMFHKNPAHQRGMITALASEYATEIVVGGRTFALKANPIKSDDGDRLGTVVEWVDRTNEVAIEKEIDNLVEAAANGDFTQDIGEAGKEGFFLRLTQGLNRLVSTANIGINDVVRVLDAISKGDLTEEITADYAGSFAQLKKYCNSTTGKLTDVVGQIRGSAGQISSGANEIAQGNADLSQRTEEQASSLEETASSMEEMTSTVKQSADNAVEANSLAQMAQGKAAQGGEVVSRAVGAMDAINKSSKEIADIIGVIDEIAFQTNLLALNAAVEAARAGEQGRGFAVVAGEVRNLAGRSATAAKEIKDLIRDSEVKVNEGTQLVNESGQTLTEIVEAVQKVSDMIADISTASQEQTEGIGQVNTAIAQMDEMTQQNAALVEEASAAGEAMAEQAKNMTQLLAFFHLDAHQSPEAMPKAVGSSYNSYSAPAPSAPRPASGGGSSEWEEF